MSPTHPGVRLRGVMEADLPLFFEHQCDAEACRIADFQSRDRPAFMAHWATILVDPSAITRAIVCDHELAGYVCSFDAQGRREIGYWIGRDFWGRGVASAAVRDFLGIERYRPLHAYIAAGNAASVRVLAKCGFAITPLRAPSDEPPREWFEAVLAR
jgi:RimJ/RimL family protein N-acetyltransferase